jgi:hypothetical protein
MGLKALIATLFLLFLAGCSPVNIEEPQKNSVHPDVPDEFIISFTANQAPALMILLNGQDVTSLFAVGDGVVTASGNTLASYTRTGTNIFEVTEPGSVAPARFVIDRVGPVVQVLNVNSSAGLQVAGYLQDDIGATSLAINGTTANLVDGAFDEVVLEDVVNNSLSWVSFDAEDAYGQLSHTVFAHPRGANQSAMLPDTLQASITDNGIQFLIDRVAEPYLSSSDLTGGLVGTVIASTNGSVGTADVTLTGLSFTPPAIVADPLASTSNARLATNVRMSRFTISVRATAATHAVDLPWPIPDIPSVSISASGTGIADNPNFSVTANLSLANNQFNVSASNASLSASNYSVDFTGITSIFEPIFDLVEPLVRGFISDLIRDQLTDRLPGIVEPLWAELPTGTDIPILGKTFNVDTNPTALASPAGVIVSMNLDTHIKAMEPVTVPQALGSIYSETALPALGNTTQSGGAYHAAAALPASALNQALLAAYYSGLTHITEAVAIGDLSAISGLDQFIGPDDEVQFSIEPTSPAYVNLHDVNGALLQVGLERFSALVQVKKPGDADFVGLFSAQLSLSAPLDVGVGNDAVDVALDGIPEVTIYTTQVLNGLNIPGSLIETLIDVLVPKIIPTLAGSLASVPLPTFSGYSIALVERWLLLPDQDQVIIAGNLVVPSNNVQAAFAVSYPEAIDIYVGEPIRSHSDYIDVLPIELLSPSVAENQTRYRVDNGEWSVWRYRHGFNLYRLLNGDHQLQICQRDIDDMIERCDSHEVSVH